jgi:hypothetical protein
MRSKKGIMNKKIVVQAIINEIEKDPREFSIRTNVVDGYEPPERIPGIGVQQNGYVPDMVFEIGRYKELFDVELDHKIELKKWKAFSLYTSGITGGFTVVIPEKDRQQTREILESNSINARIIYIT